MQEKEKTEKILEDYNDVFADIYNILAFGKKYLMEEGLESGSTESIYKAENGGLKEQRRDILKTYRKQNLAICSLGIENQSTIDKYMPLRVMGYDYATHRNQLNNDKEIKHVEEVLDLFRVFTQDDRYEDLLTEKIKDMKKKGETINMCYVLDTLEQRGIQMGISQGRLSLLKKLAENGKITLEEAAEEMEVTVTAIKEMFAGELFV